MRKQSSFYVKISLMIILVFTIGEGKAQMINWFEPVKVGANCQTIPVGPQEFYTWTPNNDTDQSEGKLRHYSEVGLDKEGKLEFKLKKEKLWLIQFAKINDEFFAVLSLPKQEKIVIYLQKILPGCALADEPKELTEFALSSKNAWVKTCAFIQSDNLKYFALCNFNAISESGKPSVPCKVFHYKMNMVSETDIPLNYGGDLVNSEGAILSNDGELFVNFKIRNPLDKNKSTKPLKDFHAFQLTTDGVLNDARFSEMQIQIEMKLKELKYAVPVGSKEGKLYVAGIFKEGIESIGTYLFKIDVASKKIEANIFQDLTDQAGLSTENILFNNAFDLLKIRQSEMLKDESILMAIQIENEQPTTAGNSVYSFHDVILCKFTSEVQHSWSANIPFHQKVEKKDLNYGGYKGILKRSDYLLVFNDSKSNYDDGGGLKLSDKKTIQPFRAYTDLGTDPLEDAVLATVQVNLESGSNYRSLITEGNFKGYMLLPNNTPTLPKANGIVQLINKSRMRYGVRF